MNSLFAGRFQPETIAGRPILELGARVWPPERYHAFQVCYSTMRWVDDLIDNQRSHAFPLAEGDKVRIKNHVFQWMLDAGESERPEVAELQGIRKRFTIPWWPWQRWTKSMLYDLDHNGFRSFQDFLRYSEGAAVAPGAIFMHLCGIRQTAEEYWPPDFDIRLPARPLAIFCYLVHIMRDFQSDQLQNLNYFADRLLDAYGLNRGDLRNIAEGRPANSAFRDMMRQYHGFARYYGLQARRRLDQIFPCLQPAYRLSLEIVYGLYQQIYEKLDPGAGRFTSDETNPTCAEVHSKVIEILTKTPGYDRGTDSCHASLGMADG